MRQNKRTLPLWFVAILAIIGFVALIIVVRAVIQQLDSEEATPRSSSNRTWLSDEWTNQPPTREQVEALVKRLQENQIKTVYVQTGAWRLDGEYRAWPYAEDFRRLLREADAQIKALDWIRVDENQYPDLDKHALVVNYVRQSMDVWGYDGVHLQGRTVYNGNEDFVRLVRALEQVVGERRTLSITAPPDHLPSDPTVPVGQGNPSISWDPRYKQQLAFLVDEMVIMAHASGLETPEEYETWVAYQVETYAEDVNRVEDIDTRLIVALPTYPVEILHDPLIENVSTATAGATRGIRAAGGAGRRIIGAGLYVYSDATSQDWAAFSQAWLK